jgi:hypothetical protein
MFTEVFDLRDCEEISVYLYVYSPSFALLMIGKKRETPQLKRPTQLKRAIYMERERLYKESLSKNGGEAGERSENDDGGENEKDNDEDNDDDDGDDDGDGDGGGDDKSDGVKEEHQDGDDGEEDEADDQRTEAEKVADVESLRMMMERWKAIPKPKRKGGVLVDGKIGGGGENDTAERYCEQVVTKEMKDAISAVVSKLVRFQTRAKATNSTNTKLTHRLLHGMQQAKRKINATGAAGGVKCVILAGNIDRGGVLEAETVEIVHKCEESNSFIFPFA